MPEPSISGVNILYHFDLCVAANGSGRSNPLNFGKARSKWIAKDGVDFQTHTKSMMKVEYVMQRRILIPSSFLSVITIKS